MACRAIQRPADIPVLRDRVGYFMCTKEGRDYLIRLPNVAYSAIDDNQELAEMMNFVVFGLGGASAPQQRQAIHGRGSGAARRDALATQSLIVAQNQDRGGRFPPATAPCRTA